MKGWRKFILEWEKFEHILPREDSMKLEIQERGEEEGENE